MRQSKKPLVLVTGAASGMGKAVMEKFQREHWDVIAIDRCAVARQPGITPVTADITQYAALRETVSSALQGRKVQAMVNAAGIFPTSTLESCTDALYRLIFDVNVLGSVNMAKVASEFISTQGGAFLLFASVDAFAVSPSQLLYSASKAAVVSLVKSLAIELVSKGIMVNAIAPGWVETEGTLKSGRIHEGVKSVPLKRAATVTEISDWAWNLCSRPSYITGETLVISGGSYMR